MTTRPFTFILLRDITVPGDVWETTRHTDEDTNPMARADELLVEPKKAEAFGLDGFSAGDHFYDSPDALIDCMASAMVTKRIKFTQTVLCNDFRNPALLAKMIASMDVFSGGRIELGIGAGYNDAEYRQASYQFDENKVRVARLREAVHIIRELLDKDEPVTFKGQYYHIDGLMNLPRPVQKHVPIRLGGGGKVMLRIAADYADLVDIMTLGVYPSGLAKNPQEFTYRSFADKINFVKECAKERADRITFAVVLFRFTPAATMEEGARIIHGEMEAAYQMHGHDDGFPLSVEEIIESPYFLMGTEGDMAAKMEKRRGEVDLTQDLIFSRFLHGMKPLVDRLKSADRKLGLRQA